MDSCYVLDFSLMVVAYQMLAVGQEDFSDVDDKGFISELSKLDTKNRY